MRRFGALAILALFAAGAAGASHEAQQAPATPLAPREAVAAWGWLNPTTSWTCYQPGACTLNGIQPSFSTSFALQPGERRVDLVLRHLSASPLRGSWAFGSGLGLPLGNGSFCGQVSDVPVPAGAAWLAVQVSADPSCSGVQPFAGVAVGTFRS